MDIALGKQVNSEELSQLLKKTLPGLPFHFMVPKDWESQKATELLDLHREKNRALVEIDSTGGFYPLRLTVWGFKGRNLNEISITGEDVALARHLSEHLRCDAVCDGSAYGDGASPYFSLLWRSGEGWLANDYGADPYDQTGQPVRPLHRLSQPLPWLGPDGTVSLR